MGINIENAKVLFVPDVLGHGIMENFYVDLAKSSIEDHNDKVKFNFIKSVLKRMRNVDKSFLPKGKEALEFNFEIDVDGISYDRPLKIVKKLGKSVVYELRIDIDEFNWYFRATFFPFYFNDVLYYCFVYPFEKVPGYEDLTNSYRDSTHELYKRVLSRPHEYFSLK